MTACVSFDFHIVFLFEAGFGVLPHSVNGNYILENMILFCSDYSFQHCSMLIVLHLNFLKTFLEVTLALEE